MTPNDLILSSLNWGDFFERVSILENTKEKGDVFERFTQLYLQAAPKYRLLLKKSLEAGCRFWNRFPWRNLQQANLVDPIKIPIV